MSHETRAGGRVAGGVLIAAAVLSFAAMLRHPEGGGGSPEALARVAAFSGQVHGVLIGLLLALLYGVAAYARERGFDKPLVLAGFTFFGVGVLMMLPAPLLNGFVLSRLAVHAEADATAAALLNFGVDVTNSFAVLASVLISLGVVLFSTGLMQDRGARRWFGLAGVIAVLPVPIALLVGALRLDVGGMTIVVATWSLWLVGLGVFMLRGQPQT